MMKKKIVTYFFILFIIRAMSASIVINSTGKVVFANGTGGVDVITGNITINISGAMDGGISGNVIKFRGTSWTNSGTWNPGTGKVEWYSTASTMPDLVATAGSNDFYDLTFLNGIATFSFSGTELRIGGTLTLSNTGATTLNISSGSLVVGNLVNSNGANFTFSKPALPGFAFSITGNVNITSNNTTTINNTDGNGMNVTGTITSLMNVNFTKDVGGTGCHLLFNGSSINAEGILDVETTSSIFDADAPTLVCATDSDGIGNNVVLNFSINACPGGLASNCTKSEVGGAIVNFITKTSIIVPDGGSTCVGCVNPGNAGLQGFPTVFAGRYGISRCGGCGGNGLLVGYDASLNKKSYTYTITNGSPAGGIWDDFIGADPVLFFGTTTGYVYAVRDSGTAFSDCVAPFQPSSGLKTCSEVTTIGVFDGSRLYIACKTTGGTPDPDYGIFEITMPASCPGSATTNQFIATDNPVFTPLSFSQTGTTRYIYVGTKKGPKTPANSYIERVDIGAGSVANSDTLGFDISAATITLSGELFTGSQDDSGTPATNEAKVIARKSIDTNFCKAYCNTAGGSCGVGCSSTESNDGPFNDRSRSGIGSVQTMWLNSDFGADQGNLNLYVCGKDGKVWGYDLVNGKNGANIDAYKKWGANIDASWTSVSTCSSGFTGSPILVGTNLYLADGCGKIYRLSITDQSVVTMLNVGNQKLLDLSYDGVNLYVGSERGRIYVITP